VDWGWIEGSRAFDITWGVVTGSLCLALAAPLLWWWLPAHRRSFFGTAIDPHYRLQLAYGLFCMAMMGTNVGCRVIDHDDLPLVHPTFFLITVALAAGLGPRILWMLARPERDAQSQSVHSQPA
jgi:hypothetical protein